MDGEMDALSKRKKNADAQAAFRARRQSYIKSLEATVSSLENAVQEMQGMCKTSTDEARLLRERATVLEGVIDELQTRLEKNAAAAATMQNPEHCECCRFKSTNSRKAPPYADQFTSSRSSSREYPTWPNQSYHPSLASSMNLNGAHTRLEQGHLERQDGPGSNPTSSRGSSSTSSKYPREGPAEYGISPPGSYYDPSMLTHQTYSSGLNDIFTPSTDTRFSTTSTPGDAFANQGGNFNDFLHHPVQPATPVPDPGPVVRAAEASSSTGRHWAASGSGSNGEHATGLSLAMAGGSFSSLNSSQLAYLMSLGEGSSMHQSDGQNSIPQKTLPTTYADTASGGGNDVGRTLADHPPLPSVMPTDDHHLAPPKTSDYEEPGSLLNNRNPSMIQRNMRPLPTRKRASPDPPTSGDPMASCSSSGSSKMRKYFEGSSERFVPS